MLRLGKQWCIGTAAVGALALLPACGGSSSTAGTGPASTAAVSSQTSETTSTTASGPPDLAISETNTPPAISGGVAYQASLVRPAILVTVPGDGWGAHQYVNKPDVNADFVLHPELGDNPDGVLSFVGGAGLLSTPPAEWINQERGLDHQALQPTTTGTIAGGVVTVEYEADVVGGDFHSIPEFSVPAGWRIHLIAVSVHGATMAIGYAALKQKFAAFATTARGVLAGMRFP